MVTKENVATVTSLRRGLMTFSVLFATFSSGGTLTVFGPALVDLQDIFNSDIPASVIFTAIGAGYFLGSMLTGVIIDRLDWIFFFMLSTSGLTASIAVLPWVPTFWLFMCLCFLLSVFQAFIDTSAAVAMRSLWGGSCHFHSMLHAIRFAWSMGTTVTPFIIEPFLSRRTAHNGTGTTHSASSNNNSHMTTVFVTTISQNSSTDTESSVQMGLFTVSCLVLVSAIFSTAAFIITRCPVRIDKSAQHEVKETQETALKYRVLFYTMLFVFYFLYVSVELSTGSLLSTFVFKALDWSLSEGALLTSVYWGIFGVSRLSAVFTVKIFSPETIIYASSICAIVTIIVLTVTVKAHHVIAWVFFPLFGFALGPLVSSGYCFAGQYLGIDGKVAACIMASIAIGITVMPFLTGYLIDTIGPMCLLYMALAGTVLILLEFLAFDIFARKFLRNTALKAHLSEIAITELSESKVNCEATVPVTDKTVVYI